MCVFTQANERLFLFFDRKKHCMGFEWVITLNTWKFWNKTTDQCCWETCGTLEYKAHRSWNTQFNFMFYLFLKETEGLNCFLSVSITTYALWIHSIVNQYWEFLNIIVYSSRYWLNWSEFIFVSLLLCKVVLESNLAYL